MVDGTWFISDFRIPTLSRLSSSKAEFDFLMSVLCVPRRSSKSEDGSSDTLNLTPDTRHLKPET